MPVGVSAYTALANLTLSSSASSVTFSSISGSYRDLVLVIQTAGTTANFPNMTVRFNGDSGSNYNGPVGMYGNGSSPASWFQGANRTDMNFTYFNLQSTDRNLFRAEILDYSATDKHKTVLARQDVPTNGTEALAGRWASTSAITSIVITVPSVSFNSGSTFALYGVSA